MSVLVPISSNFSLKAGLIPATLFMPRKQRETLSFMAPLTATLDGHGGGSGVATFARATTATYIDSSNRVASAASGVARYETNGLLMEGARTNLILQSEAFNVTWSTNNHTISANATTAPDGAGTADEIEETTGSGSHGPYQAFTAANANGRDTISVFVKKNERIWCFLQISKAGTGDQCLKWFNLDTGVLGSTSVTNWTFNEATITSFPSGWYRITLSATYSGSAARQFGLFTSTGDGNVSYAGTLGSGIFAWGAQVESDVSFATSYIPTTTATVTRNQDTLTFPAADNLPVTAPGTLMAEMDVPYVNALAKVAVDTRNSSGQQGVGLLESTGSESDIGGEVNAASSSASIIGTTAVVADTPMGGAIAFATNDVELFIDRSSEGTDTSATMPSSHTILRIGQSGASVSPWFGHIRNVLAFKDRLTAWDMAFIR